MGHACLTRSATSMESRATIDLDEVMEPGVLGEDDAESGAG